MAQPAGSGDRGACQDMSELRRKESFMTRRSARRVVQALIDFDKILALGKEYNVISEQIRHLRKRYDIDKISDAPEAREIAEELKKMQARIKEILNELTF
jgi:hypothetical protein